MAEYKIKSFEDRLRRAALRFLDLQDYNVVMENFRGYIVVKENFDYGSGHVFIKLAGKKGAFEELDKEELRKEFEEVAAAWLSATDLDDAVGPIRNDVINFYVANDDRALLRWEKDAVGWR